MYLGVMTLRPKGALWWAGWRATQEAGAEAPGGVAEVDGTGHADIYFALTRQPVQNAGVRACHAVDWPRAGAAIRLDEVAFPVGAVAHRHVHAGSGWRHLVAGALRVETAEAAAIKRPGDLWFEPADTPVRAVAQHDTGVTRFVRCMVIAPEHIGRSTFQLCDAGDADLPRLQVTHRHVDQEVQFEAG